MATINSLSDLKAEIRRADSNFTSNSFDDMRNSGISTEKGFDNNSELSYFSTYFSARPLSPRGPRIKDTNGSLTNKYDDEIVYFRNINDRGDLDPNNNVVTNYIRWSSNSNYAPEYKIQIRSYDTSTSSWSSWSNIGTIDNSIENINSAVAQSNTFPSNRYENGFYAFTNNDDSTSSRQVRIRAVNGAGATSYLNSSISNGIQSSTPPVIYDSKVTVNGVYIFAKTSNRGSIVAGGNEVQIAYQKINKGSTIPTINSQYASAAGYSIITGEIGSESNNSAVYFNFPNSSTAFEHFTNKDNSKDYIYVMREKIGSSNTFGNSNSYTDWSDPYRVNIGTASI